MANIVTTVNGMSEADLKPTQPVITPPTKPVLLKTEIEEIARELVQPWQYGTALHRFAKKHGVSLAAVVEIQAAVADKVATFGNGGK